MQKSIFILTLYLFMFALNLLPARASEQGNVIRSVCIYIYIYICVQKKM